MRDISVCSWMAVLATALLLATGPAGAQTTWYVRHPAGGPYGSGNGDSWTNAATDPEAIVEGAGDGDTVYIAEGEYVIADTIFQDNNNVQVLGSVPEGSPPDESARSVDDSPTTFTGNGADLRIYHEDNNANVILDALVFTGVDYGSPGAINLWAGGTGCVMRNCIVADITARYGVISTTANYRGSFEGCRFVRNVGDNGGGGAIRVTNCNLQFTDCVFADNTATGGGAAVYARLSSAVRNLDFTNCVFTGNSSQGSSGGALHFQIPSGGPYDETFTGCAFSGNRADGNGGAFYSAPTFGVPATFDFADCAFTTNVATAAGAGSDYEGGGAVHIENSTINMTRCVLSGNTSGLSGGGVALATVDATLTSLTVTGNVATGTGGGSTAAGGGGLNLRRGAGTLDEGCIVGNLAAHNGGGLNVTNEVEGPVAIADCWISDNTSQAAGSDDNGGGGVYIDSANPTLRDVRVFRNAATASRGGGLFMQQCAASVEDCEFIDNVAELYGGGVAAYDDSDGAALTNCLIAGNTCMTPHINVGGGGVAIVDRSDVEVTSCVITANVADPNGSVNGSGGGLSIYLNNYGAAPGEGKVRNTVIAGNALFDTSVGLHGGGGVNIRQSDPLFENCLIAGNWSDQHSGAVRIDHGQSNNVAFVNCAISNNNAAATHKALAVYGAADVTLANCLITGNGSTGGSWILTEAHDTAEITLHHCLFDGNDGIRFRDNNTADSLNSEAELNSPEGGTGAGNLVRAASFPVTPTGTWDVNAGTAVYDPATGRTTLDLGGSFTPGELAGLFINPDIDSQNKNAYILSNTATSVVVGGNITWWLTFGAPANYVTYDFRIRDSAAEAVEAGTDTVAPWATSPPAYDFAGNPRPVSGGFTSVGYDIGPFEITPASAGGPGSAVGQWQRY